MKLRSLSVSLAALPLSLVALACSDTTTRVYSIDVKNVSSRTITIGPAKLGGPPEPHWYSPEDLAISAPKDTMVGWGTVVPPGKTAYIDKLTGEFSPGTSAVLRIYAGDMPLSDMLAISKDSRSRVDQRLEEGKSTYVVSDRGPYIDAFRTEYIPGGEMKKK
jgi:hypothetical protein